MTCYSPHVILQDKIHLSDKGKPTVKKFIDRNEAKQMGYEYFDLLNEKMDPFEYQYTKIPCNRCIGCKRDYTKNWSQRLMHEQKLSNDSWFLTITYNEENKPYNDKFIDTETGEIYEDNGNWNGYLKESDMQKYIKRIRENWYRKENHYYKTKIDKNGNKKIENTIKYYYCGEYGGLTKRPHYHMIIFNLPIPDLKEYIKSEALIEGQKMLYTSKTLEELWGKGRILIGQVTQESCNYVAGYCQKKMYRFTGELRHELYAKAGQTEEYTRMSKAPAIGRKWYEENKNKIYETDEVIITRKGKATVVKPAKYYDRLYDIEYPEDFERIKEQRKEKAKAAEEVRKKQSTYTLAEELKIKEKTAIEQTNRWLRGKAD